MTELLQKAIDALQKLPARDQDDAAAWILERLGLSTVWDENEWDNQIASVALGTALSEDGTIDFEQLYAKGVTVTLDELYPDGDN
jgi:hypothetical protein